MPAPAHSPKRDTQENCTIQTLIETIKALHALVATVMADQAALRRTILEDASFAMSYEMHLKAAADSARPLLLEALESYDALMNGPGRLEN
jgi:hypothetical protein